MITNWTYLIINIATVFFPVLFWNYHRLPSKRVFKHYWKALRIAGVGFIIWDVFVTWRGHWLFNPVYTLGIKLFNLPIEEVLFFISIPFSSLYLFEVLNLLKKDTKLLFDLRIFKLIGLCILMISVFWLRDKEYTFIISSIVGFLFMLSSKYLQLFQSQNFWVYQLLMLIPFGLVNGLLTSLPVVMYSSEHILNIRVGTIPIEDAFYSFALLTSYLIFYQKSKNIHGI